MQKLIMVEMNLPKICVICLAFISIENYLCFLILFPRNPVYTKTIVVTYSMGVVGTTRSAVYTKHIVEPVFHKFYCHCSTLQCNTAIILLRKYVCTQTLFQI